MMVGGIVVLLPTFILNVLTFINLARHNQKQGTNKKVREQHQFNLAIMALSQFLSDTVFVVYMVGKFIELTCFFF
jgi:hypothetical protein